MKNGIRTIICLLGALISAGVLSGCGGGGGSSGLGVGNRGGDTIPPVITLASPAPDSRVSDSDFRSQNFVMRFSYGDASPIAGASIKVTLKMDSGQAQDVTSYFSAGTGSIQSADLYQFTRSLFEIATNNTGRKITVTAEAKDSAQNLGQTTASFTVYPSGAPPPPQ